jgi:hypothetical protein
MRNLLALLAAVFLLFAGLGWWRSWYSLSSQPAETGKVAFRVEVNPIKVGTDVFDLARWARGASEKSAEKAEEKPKAE